MFDSNQSRRKSSTHMKTRFFAALLILVAPAFAAQQPTPSAPIPALILSAQKVFLANCGADPIFAEAFHKAGQKNEPYNSTYAALRSWGHWKLVATPDDADLVVIVSATAPPEDYANGMPLSYSPRVELRIFDAKSHFLLWTITQPVQGAFRASTWKKNFQQGLEGLTDQLKFLTAPATP